MWLVSSCQVFPENQKFHHHPIKKQTTTKKNPKNKQQQQTRPDHILDFNFHM